MIIFESVTKQFGDDSIALQDISFQIKEGELVVVTGHSGSGKTTLMKLLTKEYLPTSGEIFFNDVPLSDIKGGQVAKHRRQLGIVFQDYKLLPELNVWENIALALNIMGKDQNEIEVRVTDLLRLVDLVEKAFLFPSQLSGGEAQRVSIARALATAPQVIFADEPTGNLDPETSVGIAKLLEKINDLGTTVIIATHDISVMDVLTKERHLKLEKGRLVKDSAGPIKTKPAKSVTHQPHHHEPDHSQKEEPAEPKDKPEPEANLPPEATQPAPDKKAGFKLGMPKISLPFGKGKKAAPSKGEPTSEPKPETKHPETKKHVEPADTETVKVEVESLD